MKKQVLVSVDRGETRVALMEASGSPAAAQAKKPAARSRSRKTAASDYRVA